MLEDEEHDYGEDHWLLSYWQKNIINGELAADKVYENDYVLAFLDIAPINKGHVLVIPKEHHSSICSVSSIYHQHMLSSAAAIGRAIVRGCDYDGFNLHLANGGCAGQAVPHAHIHVIPRVGTDGFHWNWRSLKYEEGEQSDIISKIHNKLKIDES